MAMAYVDLPQVEMRPLASSSSSRRFDLGGRHSAGITSSSSAVGSSSSTSSSPTKLDRKMEEINLQLEDDFTEDRFLVRKNSEFDQEFARDEYVATPSGCVFVEVVGDTRKTPILTYHDIGMNRKSSFSNFFFCSDMMPLAEHFCVYHINAPGQEEGAPRLPPDFAYPTMEGLSDQVECVVEHFRLRRVIGLASGAGANVLARFAFNHPDRVQALILANPTAGSAGWIEWGYQKVNSRYLKKEGIGNFSFDYLLWHYFGRKSAERQLELKEEVRENLGNMEPFNLALFIDSYTKRDKLPLNGRAGLFGFSSDPSTLRCSTLLLVGDDSPHLDDVTAMNAVLDPAKTNYVKISDCGGLVLEEQPEKSAEAIRLFLQGMGYITLLKSTRLAPTGIGMGIAMARCKSAFNLLSRDGLSKQRTASLSSLH